MEADSGTGRLSAVRAYDARCDVLAYQGCSHAETWSTKTFKASKPTDLTDLSGGFQHDPMPAKNKHDGEIPLTQPR